MIYRFRVFFEDHEDVYREIEIKSNQHFDLLHNAILQSIGFDNQHNASFFLSNDSWRKGEEIILREESNSKNSPKKVMSKSKLSSFIDDPHQKFIYVYDPSVSWTLMVELMKILDDDPKANYPQTIKTVGQAPKQYKSTLPPPPVDEDDDDDDSNKSIEHDEIFSTEEGLGEDDEDDINKMGDEGEDEEVEGGELEGFSGQATEEDDL